MLGILTESWRLMSSQLRLVAVHVVNFWERLLTQRRLALALDLDDTVLKAPRLARPPHPPTRRGFPSVQLPPTPGQSLVRARPIVHQESEPSPRLGVQAYRLMDLEAEMPRMNAEVDAANDWVIQARTEFRAASRRGPQSLPASGLCGTVVRVASEDFRAPLGAQRCGGGRGAAGSCCYRGICCVGGHASSGAAPVARAPAHVRDGPVRPCAQLEAICQPDSLRQRPARRLHSLCCP